jgi:hypothetical protein
MEDRRPDARLDHLAKLARQTEVLHEWTPGDSVLPVRTFAEVTRNRFPRLRFPEDFSAIEKLEDAKLPKWCLLLNL